MKTFPIVRFSEVLRRVDRFEPRNDLIDYQFAGTYSFARGIFRGGRKLGSTFSLPKVQRIRSEDFVYCKIMAWEGAFGVVPPDCDNCVMSGAFVVYEIDRLQVDPRYLNYFFKVPAHWQTIGRQSTGTNVRRRSLHPNQFEAARFPLPPLSEQRRIVAKIDELAAKIEKARGLHQETTEEAGSLIDSTTTSVFKSRDYESFLVTIEKADLQINRESRDPAKTNPGSEFIYIDISSVKPGPSTLNEGKVITTNEAPSRARRVVKKDDIIISTVRPNLRAFAKIGEKLHNQICSTGFAVFSCGASINPDFLLHQFCSPFFIDQCVAKTTGGHYPAINDTNLKKILIIAPPLPVQLRIVAYLDGLQTKVEGLKQLQTETGAEVEALLPSILDKAFKGEL